MTVKTRLALFWTITILLIILPRVILQNALPIYLFSDDSHSYLLSAFQWMQTGDWVTSPRRGAVYSLLIGGILAGFHDLRVITCVQHFLGGLAIAMAIWILQKQAGMQRLWLTCLVAASLALAGFPIFYEQAIRSENLLLVFSTTAFAGWIHYSQSHTKMALFVTGVAFGLATLIKNLLLPLPLVIGFFLLTQRQTTIKDRSLRLLIFGLAIATPFLGNVIFNRASGGSPESAPQSGILLYGRVAQWTVLDSSLHSDIKKVIRPDIEAYRKLPRLNNNIILKKTAVPHIATWLGSRGGNRKDLNSVCRDLAFEAIRTHPREWFTQIVGDIARLHLKMDFPFYSPDSEDLQEALSATSKIKHQDSILHQAEVIQTLENPKTVAKLGLYHSVVAGAWLFLWKPVLLTTLLLPFLFVLDPNPERKKLWLTAAVVWFFNVFIVCTVGRPIPRYLVAVFPIMFWAIGGSVLLLFAGLNERFIKRPLKTAVIHKAGFRD